LPPLLTLRITRPWKNDLPQYSSLRSKLFSFEASTRSRDVLQSESTDPPPPPTPPPSVDLFIPERSTKPLFFLATYRAPPITTRPEEEANGPRSSSSFSAGVGEPLLLATSPFSPNPLLLCESAKRGQLPTLVSTLFVSAFFPTFPFFGCFHNESGLLPIRALNLNDFVLACGKAWSTHVFSPPE